MTFYNLSLTCTSAAFGCKTYIDFKKYEFAYLYVTIPECTLTHESRFPAFTIVETPNYAVHSCTKRKILLEGERGRLWGVCWGMTEFVAIKDTRINLLTRLGYSKLLYHDFVAQLY